MASNAKKTYVDIVHDQKQIKTITEFCAFYKITGITPERLFDDNRIAIFNAMSLMDKIQYAASKGKSGAANAMTPGDLEYTMTLPRFCVIRVYYQNVTPDNVIYATNMVSNVTDYKAWSDERLKEITENSGYVANAVTQSYVKMAPNVRVVGWFKVKEFLHSETNNPQAFVDISRYVSYMTTNVTETGGNFSLSLPFVPADPTKLLVKTSNGGQEIMNQLEAATDDYYKATFRQGNFYEFNYFDWLISPNDILFLRFERLAMEEDIDQDSEVRIAGGVWDMIALVDAVTTNTDAFGNVINIQVSGRDLMKLLIDDGSYFYSVSVQADAETMFPNVAGVKNTRFGDRKNDLLNIANAVDRVRANSGYIMPFQQLYWTVESVLKKTILRLANIAIAPNDVFKDWGDARSTITDYKTNPESPEKKLVNDGK